MSVLERLTVLTAKLDTCEGSAGSMAYMFLVQKKFKPVNYARLKIVGFLVGIADHVSP